jgi:hypothetical protein
VRKYIKYILAAARTETPSLILVDHTLLAEAGISTSTAGRYEELSAYTQALAARLSASFTPPFFRSRNLVEMQVFVLLRG